MRPTPPRHIALLTPPWTYRSLGARRPLPGGRDVSGQGLLPPLGLHHLATSLELHGHRATVLPGYGRSQEELLRATLALRPDAAGISVVSPLWPAARRLARALRERGIPVIAGGPHAGLAARELLADVDAVSPRNGERALLDWLGTGFARGTFGPGRPPLSHPRGWASRLATRVTWKRTVPNLVFLRDPPQATSTTSVGCPGSCASCRVSIGFQRRSTDELLEEMLALDRVAGVRTLSFVDDTPLFAEPRRVLPLVEALQRARPRLRWTLYLDRWDLDLQWFAELRRAGLRRVLFLVESGSDRVRRYAKGREVPRDAIARSVEAAAAAGIEACARFQLGYPGETAEDARESIALALDLPLFLATFIRAMAYPGSRMALDHQRADQPPVPLERWSYYGRPVEPLSMSPRERDALLRQALLAFYGRPRALARVPGPGPLARRALRALAIGRRVLLDRTE